MIGYSTNLGSSALGFSSKITGPFTVAGGLLLSHSSISSCTLDPVQASMPAWHENLQNHRNPRWKAHGAIQGALGDKPSS